MKLLAIEKETSPVNWNEENEVLVEESYRVYHLFQRGLYATFILLKPKMQ
ncbi:MAG: hypothetical protein U0Z17_08775 [Bacteroidales bacterium]